MNLLISNLMHWFVFGSTMFLAAGAVADAGAAPAGAAGGGGTPSTGTESSTATAGPGETTAPASTEGAPANLADIVKRATENAEKQLTKPGVPAETAPEAPKTEPAKPAVETAEAKPAAEIPVENPLDKLGPLPAEKITAALKDAPEAVTSFLKEKGLDVDTLTETARQAAQASQFMEFFPGGVESAKEAMDGFQNFAKIDEGLAGVKDIESFDKLMTSLAEMTFVRDAEGNPVPDPEHPGSFKNNGSLAKMIDYSAMVRDTNLEKLADMLIDAAGQDEDAKGKATDLKGALQYVAEFVRNGYKFGGENIDPKTLPAEVQERLSRADKIEKEASERAEREQTQQYETAEDSIIQETHKGISPMIEQALKDVPLSAKLKANIGKQVWETIVENMTKNELYKRQRDTLSRQGTDYSQRRVALNLNYLKPVAARALAEIVGEIAKPTVDANKARHDKIDAQTEAGRMEPRTSGTTLQSHGGVMSAEDIGKKALEMARQTNPNAQPGGAEYFAAVSKLKNLPISA